MRGLFCFLRALKSGSLKFPEWLVHLCTGQFNIQGRLGWLTDNSHLSPAAQLLPSPALLAIKPK
jgi:hypothetical protein